MTVDRKTTPLTNQRYIRVGPGSKCKSTKFYTQKIDPLVEEETKVVIEGITTIERIIGQIIENRSRGRWNNHRSDERSSNYK